MNRAIGIDIGGSKMRIFERRGLATRYVTIPTGEEIRPRDLEKAIQSFMTEVEEPPVGIGIAVPGLVDNGRVVCSDVLPQLQGWNPSESLPQDCPVTVLNDVEAAAREVMVNGTAGETMAMVMVGTGVGLAMTINGQLFRGDKGWAGEIGYLPLCFEGEDLNLDAVAGGAAMLQRLGCNAAHAHALLEAVDPESCAIIRRGGKALGFALASLINLMNPNRVVLAGGTLRYPGYLESTVAAARRWALPELFDSCQIEVPEDGQTLPARGAATVALARAKG